MKKIFTLACAALLAMGMTTQAQTLYYGERALADGETINLGYDDENELSFLSYVWDFDLFLDIPQASTFTIKVETSENCSVSDYLQVCGTGGCENLNNGKSHSQSTPSAYIAGRYPMQIERFLDRDMPLTEQTVKVTVTVGMRSLTVTYVCKPHEKGAAIKAIGTAANGNYVKAAGRNLNYNLPKGNLTLFALTGARVMDIKVAGGQGSASLAGLRPGVYLFRAGSLSGKILVK